MDVFKNLHLTHKTLFQYITILALVGCGGSSSSEDTASRIEENRVPRLSSPTSFTVDENTTFSTNIIVSDDDGDSVTVEVDSASDGAYFLLQQSSNLISNSRFDFEFPGDSNKDNIYELVLRISDGKATINETISISINDIDGPLACGEEKIFSIQENTMHQTISFDVVKPDSEMILVQQSGLIRVTNAGGAVVEDNMKFINKRVEVFDENDEDNDSAKFLFELISPINAEEYERSVDPFTFSLNVSLGDETVTCFATVQIVDINDEVASGIKFSGSDRNNRFIKSYNVGDINKDGVSELWVSTQSIEENEPWGHRGYLIDGKSLQQGENKRYGFEFLLESAQDEVILQVSGKYPSLGIIDSVIDLTGYELIPQNMGDLDSDGIDDLLITMSLSNEASNHSFAGRPVAFILWGETLLSESHINLNELSAEQGITIDWQSRNNRRGNVSLALNLDNDGLNDIVISLPSTNIRASENSGYRGHTFVLFSNFLKKIKSRGLLNLADYLVTSQTNEVLVLTTEAEFQTIDKPLEIPLLTEAGSVQSSLKDLDGDNADELLLSAKFIVPGQPSSADFVILSSKYIQSSKKKMDLLLAKNIPPDRLEIIRHYGQLGFVGLQQGDADNDGINDLLFSSYHEFNELPVAGLISGSNLFTDSNPEPTIIHLTEQDITLFNFLDLDPGLNKPVVLGVEFISDLDEDGRDDFIFHTEVFSTTSLENVTAIVLLSTAIDSIQADKTFNLNELEAGKALYVVNSSISLFNKEADFRVIGDIDNDGFDELSLTPINNSTENYILRGETIKQKIDEAASSINISKEFRNSEEN